MILVDRYTVFRIQYPNALPRIDPSDYFNNTFKNEFVKKLEEKQGRPEDGKVQPTLLNPIWFFCGRG